MAHNAYIHGGQADPTAWLPGYEVLQLDFQKIDDYLFQAINGDLGGTWAPASRIVLGGVGLEVTTAFLVTGLGQANFYSGSVVIDSSAGVTFAGIPVIFDPTTAVTFQNGLDTDPGTLCSIRGGLSVGTNDLDLFAVFATTNFNEDVNMTTGVKTTFGGDTQFDAQNVFNDTTNFASTSVTAFDAQVFFNATAIVAFTSGSTITGAVDANLDFDGTSAISIGASGTFSMVAGSVFQLEGVIAPAAGGHIRKRIFTGTDADNITVGIADGDVIVIPAFSAARTWTLTSTGAAEGDEILMNGALLTGAYDLSIVDDGAAPIGVIHNNASGEQVSILWHYRAGAWRADAITHRP